MKCADCGSTRIKKAGHVTRMNKGRHQVRYQIYKCVVCGKCKSVRLKG